MNHKKRIISPFESGPISRRKFVTGAAAGGALLGLGLQSDPTLAAASTRQSVPTLRGSSFDIDIGYKTVNFTGHERPATAFNGTVPGPVLRWKEGERVTLRVTNHLAHDSSIHWHGMILEAAMDGVPGISFDGIKPGETFTYQFDVRQNGTFWYHSHSDFQEQTGLYGAIVIDPAKPDPVSFDRDYVVVLSDWSDETPERIYRKLKKQSDYYNFRQRTAGDFFRDVSEKGLGQTRKDRAMWNQMRMSDRDLSDVTGYTYTFLMNGATPDDGWLGLFKRGEKIRLRFVNGSAMSIYDVRIPGLKMTVVAADGQNIEPVSIDEFRIAVAETYDVIVEPNADSAYTIFAQNIDRTGYARGILSPDPNWTAEVPPLDPPPLLGHRDMGMGDMSGMSGMDHDMSGMSGMSGMDHDMSSMSGMDNNNSEASGKSGMDHDMSGMSGMSGMDHSKHDMSGMSGMQEMPQKGGEMLDPAGYGSKRKITHVATEFGPHVDMRAATPADGLSDPGIGLRDNQRLYNRRVLTYADIRNLEQTEDRRDPEREIELHLTGNMTRYMWSMNGIKFKEADLLRLSFGERVRISLVNDTMMTHPIHLHGMWSELETGDPEYMPRKHTVIVQPGSRISYLVTADAMGGWAFHCHLIYHMPGMFREVRVS
ncbi:MAG: copper resistance system multicopper oxidase [Gammaproteobacteria bacterium]|nr:copper resistance system multicopper oxidase [Gammaproteobacteria bacterium]